MRKIRLKQLFEKPPVLTIEEVKKIPRYNKYIAENSYGMAQRAIQRDFDYNHILKRLQDVLPSMKAGLW